MFVVPCLRPRPALDHVCAGRSHTRFAFRRGPQRGGRDRTCAPYAFEVGHTFHTIAPFTGLPFCLPRPSGFPRRALPAEPTLFLVTGYQTIPARGPAGQPILSTGMYDVPTQSQVLAREAPEPHGLAAVRSGSL